LAAILAVSAVSVGVPEALAEESSLPPQKLEGPDIWPLPVTLMRKLINATRLPSPPSAA
jgi:hypothetical protein